MYRPFHEIYFSDFLHSIQRQFDAEFFHVCSVAGNSSRDISVAAA